MELQVADAIRSEASNLLDEVKSLSQRNETLEAEVGAFECDAIRDHLGGNLS